ncbi:MAG: hypothetical protein SNJ77_07450 [Cytophagales bacterium]
MMRKTLFIYLVLNSFFYLAVNGQNLPVDNETKRITFQGVVEVNGLESALIYERAMEFINSKSQQKWFVRDLDSKKLSKPMDVQATTTYDYKYKNLNIVTFVILVEVKEGKYRYTLNEFETYKHKNGPNSSEKLELVLEKMTAVNKKEMVTQTTDEVNKLLDELKEYVIKGKGKANKDDW